jgi:hypothetical protein
VADPPSDRRDRTLGWWSTGNERADVISSNGQTSGYRFPEILIIGQAINSPSEAVVEGCKRDQLDAANTNIMLLFLHVPTLPCSALASPAHSTRTLAAQSGSHAVTSSPKARGDSSAIAKADAPYARSISTTARASSLSGNLEAHHHHEQEARLALRFARPTTSSGSPPVYMLAMSMKCDPVSRNASMMRGSRPRCTARRHRDRTKHPCG